MSGCFEGDGNGGESVDGAAPPTSERSSTDQRDGFRVPGRARSVPFSVAPLDLRILGRTLLHAAVVGATAGLIGAAFFAALEWGQHLLLETFAGYSPARSRGETFLTAVTRDGSLRTWALVVLPALGALVSGIVTHLLAPEAAGGGGDAIIESYHRGALIRRRLVVVKGMAAVATLSSGGSGGREGPTMQIGGALGAWVARSLASTPRERRILIVAGIAAGMSAVFRTPLGAALLATEMLYRDDFESDALVPAILASVVSYSVAISLLGQTTMFGHLPPFAFVPAHLPLYVGLAVVVALLAVSFLFTLRAVQRFSASWRVPRWLRPGLGGLAMGAFGTVVLLALRHGFGPMAAHLGVFGGGYGVAQAALASGDGLPTGWTLVLLLAALGFAKMIATALTIGTGGAAGDFAPSLVMGALVGGAFGRAAALLLGDPRIDPGAFALVGMGTFYGGIAHAPLSAVVIVCELAGSYDLLVPLMLAVCTALVALRRWSLYGAQLRTRTRAEPQPRGAGTPGLDALRTICATDVLLPVEVGPLGQDAPIADVLAQARRVQRQKVLVVSGRDAQPLGLIDVAQLGALDSKALDWAVAGDAIGPYADVASHASLMDVDIALQKTGSAQVPVVSDGVLVGFVGETEVARAYWRAVR